MLFDSPGFAAQRLRRRGFTIVELLVLIGIIGLLMGLLLPVLGSAKRQMRAAACMSNLRQPGALALLAMFGAVGRSRRRAC